jgi:hypothetical protein
MGYIGHPRGWSSMRSFGLLEKLAWDGTIVTETKAITSKGRGGVARTRARMDFSPIDRYRRQFVS